MPEESGGLESVPSRGSDPTARPLERVRSGVVVLAARAAATGERQVHARLGRDATQRPQSFPHPAPRSWPKTPSLLGLDAA
jgi:hypothetical protein